MIRDACKRGVAAVVVTHDAHLASWADRVVFLRDGRVVDHVAPDAPDSLIAPSAGTWRDRARVRRSLDEHRRPRTARRRPARRRRRARPAGRRPLGLAPLPAGVASAVPDPRPHHRRGRGDDRRLGRRDEQPAAEELRLRHGAGLRVLHDLRRAHGERHREPGAPLRPRRGDRERDAVDPGIDQHLSAPCARPARTLQRSDALARLRALPVGRRPGRRDERRRVGVPPEGGSHLASRWRRAPGGRHRREPPEPPRRVRARRTRAGDTTRRESRRCSTRRAFR